MSALTTRAALAKALTENMACEMGDVTDDNGTSAPYALCTSRAHNWARHDGRSCEFADDLADFLLASGAVVDAATLADDNALIERLSRGRTARHTTRSLLRALATALSERSSR